MIAVIFEVTPQPDCARQYFDSAAALRESLESVDGFISVERFQSLSRPDTYLSMSYWRDEAAAARWRNQPQHRATQRRGRDSIFAHYRIRVASVLRDYDMRHRAEAPADSDAVLPTVT